jgi:hypothetical protein
LKTNITISALFTAAAILTPAHATSILFTAVSTLPATGNTITLNDNAGSIAGYGFDGVFSNATPPSTVAITGSNPDKISGGTAETLDTTGAGLGLASPSSESPYIGPGDAVVLDFANVKNPDTYNGQTGQEYQVTFNMKIDLSGPSDWTVYGYNAGSGDYVLLGDGPMGSGGNPTFSTTTLYSSYLVGVTNDCGLTITSVDVAYTAGTTIQQTPEPGTFVMAGMALIGLGVTIKKRNRKA